MKKIVWSIIVFVSLLVINAKPANAQVATPNQGLGFTYDITNFLTSEINRFEMKVDDTPYQSVGIPQVVEEDATSRMYRVPLLPLTPGLHTVVFRACNSNACSPDSSPLSFRLVVLVAPSNLRLVP